MTTSQDLLSASYDALASIGRPLGVTVATPRDWPNQADTYPIWKVRLLSEDKSSLGRSGVQFTVVATIRIIVELSEPVQINDLGATQLEVDLWKHVRLIERGLINSYPLTGLLQQFPTIRTQLDFNADGATHLGGAQIDIGMEFFQDESDFAPIGTVDLDEIALRTTATPPTGFDADLNP